MLKLILKLSPMYTALSIERRLIDQIVAAMLLPLECRQAIAFHRIVNLAVGVFMILGGIAQFFPVGFADIIKGCYVILFGLATGLLEFQIPPQIAKHASFMFSFVGRGVFYIFIGSVVVGEGWWKYVVGAIIGLIGIGYVALEYVPSIEPPANMRDADAGWGAEQV
ncbi:hypothetical protein EJ05DRAFT_502789 [Pseudovirgaria hyperparasitica]|uniref:COPI associated n=1 Tax=Pseudovirgaria hyperparasitica TaxID=470096 RepID=A0A6A6W160_9PEZI|nr:uncharacterized protein EJ05DRAFT_502789 [Pseudovirgaria hyperparasitica]KAF2755317.1 hypothetical protein EJ05DRAFT_502789 [Pseudovirgaria hyperparasitica]